MYNATLQESGGVAPFTWSINSGSSLPPGLNLGSGGTITGTPTAGGTVNVSVQVADSGNPPLAASADLSITVTVLPLSIVTTSLSDATLDIDYKQSVQATGGIPPYSWTVASGTLPTWATLATSGTLSGIPGAAGTSNFTVQVADSETTVLTSQQSLSLTTVAISAANNPELSGHYAFLFNGFDDTTGSQVAIVGSFTADGKGNLSAGVEDENGPGGPPLNTSFSGTYSVASDHRGAFTIDTAGGSRTFALVLQSINAGVAQKACFAEFDDTSGTVGQRGSGLLFLQDTTAFSLSKITGPYAFGFAGQDSIGNREVWAGAFQADGAGVVSTGVADENIAGTATNPNLTGTFTAPDAASGRATMTLNPSGASSLNFAVLVISSSQLLAISTNGFSSDGLVSGTILSQTSISFDNKALDAAAVFWRLGVSSSGSDAEIGQFVADGNGGLSATFDRSLPGGLFQDQTFTATYLVLGPGRATVSGWNGNASGPSQIIYLVDKNSGFLLDTGAGSGLGFVEPQSGAPAGGFSNTSFSGTFLGATLAPAASKNSNATGIATPDGSGNFTEYTDLSNTAGLFVHQKVTGAYSVAANGRGAVTNLITTAGIGGPVVAIVAAIWLFLSRRMSGKGTSRPATATFCFALMIAAIPQSCTTINKLVFYVISPQRAVMIPERSFNGAPEITILQR